MTGFSSQIPIWFQLMQMLRSEIVSGQRHPGQRIESEVRMADRHGVSVMPVRQAYRALEKEGLIVRQRGSGTYVSHAQRPPADWMTPLEALYSREFIRPAKILAHGSAATPPELQPYFADVEMNFVRRLAFRAGSPWSYGVLYYPSSYAMRIDTDDLTRYPLYRVLRERIGIALVRSHFEVKAAAASADEAANLGLDAFAPILSLRSVGFDKAGSPVGAFQMAFPGDPLVIEFETAHEPY